MSEQQPFGYLYENAGGTRVFHRQGDCSQKLLNADMEAASLHPTGHRMTTLYERPAMTADEEAVLRLSAQLWNDFCTLPDSAVSDVDDFYRAIHELQRIVALRAMRRAAPDFFTQHKDRT